MTIQEKNYSAEHTGPFETLLQRDFMGFHGKYFIGENLGLTGCEVSLNRLPAGKGMPFVHAHKKNEELYIVLRGNGTFFVDGEEFPKFPLTAENWANYARWKTEGGTPPPPVTVLPAGGDA